MLFTLWFGLFCYLPVLLFAIDRFCGSIGGVVFVTWFALFLFIVWLVGLLFALG